VGREKKAWKVGKKKKGVKKAPLISSKKREGRRAASPKRKTGFGKRIATWTFRFVPLGEGG